MMGHIGSQKALASEQSRAKTLVEMNRGQSQAFGFRVVYIETRRVLEVSSGLKKTKSRIQIGKGVDEISLSKGKTRKKKRVAWNDGKVEDG